MVPVLPGGALTDPPARSVAKFDPLTAKVSGRGERFTDFVNPDGTHTQAVAADVVNFRDAAGVWHPVDTGVEVDPDVPGGARSKANAWRARFGVGGVVSWESASGAGVGLVPVGGALVSPSVSGSQAQYSRVWPGVDVSYEVTGSAVKESILIGSASGPSSFEFKVVSGRGAAVSAGRGSVVSFSGVSLDAAGFLPLDRAGLSGLRLAAPMVLGAGGVPVLEAGAAMRVTTSGTVMVSVDSAWLAGLPADAFPVILDPTLVASADDERAYKSDGSSCSLCGIKMGNSRDNNTDKYWRSTVRYPYSGLWNKLVIDAWMSVSYRAGSSSSSLPIKVWLASDFSYAGVIQSDYDLASGSLGAGLTNNGTRLPRYIQEYVNTQNPNAWFGFTGAETAGSYTYQMIYATLYVTYTTWPSAPVRVAPSPADGSSAHTLSYTLAASSTDADGDSLLYWFRASLNPDPAVSPVVDTQGLGKVVS